MTVFICRTWPRRPFLSALFFGIVLLAHSSLAAPIISAPFAAAPIDFARRAGIQNSAEIASGAEISLIIWKDNNPTTSIRGARMKPNGEILDPGGFVIHQEATDPTLVTGTPAVGSNGENFLVAWVASNPPNASNSVMAVQIGTNGVVGPEFAVGFPAIVGHQPAISAIGSKYLVAWTRRSYLRDSELFLQPTSEVYGTLVENGAALKTFAIGPAFDKRSPAVANNGTEFLVTYVGSSDLYARRVSTDGDLLETNPAIIHGAAGPPAISSIGDTFLVVWSYNSSLYGARFRTEQNQLTVLDPAGYLIWGGFSPNNPALASNGENFLVTYNYFGEINGFWLDSDGVRQGSTPISFGPDLGDEGGSAVTAQGANYFAVWAAGEDIYYSDVKSGGEAGPARLLTSEPTQINSDKIVPKVVFNGSTYFAIWEDGRNMDRTGTKAIYGCRISPDGQVLDPYGIEIESENNPSSPDCAVVGGDFVCVWKAHSLAVSEPNSIYVSWIGADGVFKRKPFLLASDGNASRPSVVSHPVVAGSGNRGLIAFYGTTNNIATAPLTNGFIYGFPFENTGGEISGGPRVQIFAIDKPGPQSMALAGSVNGFFLAWAQSDVDGDVYGHVISPDATSYSGNIPVGEALGGQISPTVAGNDSGYVIAWQDDRNAASSGTDIYANFISAAGVPAQQGGWPVTTTAGSQLKPIIESDGDRFLLVWQNTNQTGASYAGIHLDPAGAVEGTEFPIAADLPSETIPGLSYSRNGRYLFVTGSTASIPTLNGRFLDELPRLISISVSGNSAIVNWIGEAGQTYKIEYKDDLSAAAWQPLGSDLPATGSTQTTAVEANSSTRFYHLRRL